jgi:hypothetical protein
MYNGSGLKSPIHAPADEDRRIDDYEEKWLTYLKRMAGEIPNACSSLRTKGLPRNRETIQTVAMQTCSVAE